MKTYKYILVLMGLSILGCSDLEESPITQLSPDDYFSSLSLEQVEGFVSGAYVHMLHRNFLSREMAQALEFRSDMTAIGRTGVAERVDMDNFTVSSDNALIIGSNGYWPKVYQIIRAANDGVQAGKQLTEGDENEINEVIARGRFARALAYYHLVRQFGDIPYLDDTTPLSEATVAPRTPAAEVYAKIIEDLEYAKEWLPNTQPTRALPAKSAASAYLASVHLTMENWQLAYDEAKDVINNAGTYNLALEPDFQNLFDAVKVDASLEPIFVLDFTGVSDGDQGRDYQAPMTGSRGDKQYLPNINPEAGWSVQVPSLKVYTTWDENDYRRAVSLDDTMVFEADENGNGPRVDYTGYVAGNSLSVNRPHIAKYTRMASKLPTQDGNGRGSHSNYMLMRYAEVLLIAAEAANEIGLTSEAEDLLNQVRARARKGGVTNGYTESASPADVSGTSQDEFRFIVLEERRLELAFEFKRWYDIARRKMGDAPYNVFGSDGLESEVSTESGVGPGPKSFDSSRDYLFPIPIDEIIINPNLVQNPGY
ncbi:SusD-like protein [Formosa agariphila KMM 3901]|uniref:SusD-like protein n=1 Tax=Formosa agariphila (strain DSM 15362 / KCTC 12365 / LMG 23005 / KMM 3901 / M-2Alg 35-1) TaxID=1347342 RepID=T2KIN1_FORAG|nr:RagB/SusD family nutrient uptake outer membrane protein [Formosa agariphila]CDF78665.1 SusD-like protein [Formosa agariphila KMM 3901]